MIRPWVQAALDVEDIDFAKRIALTVLDQGAEWLEVGTPLLYRYGYSAISEIRKTVGADVVLIADYKSIVSRLCATQAAQAGADYVLLSTGYIDFIRRDNIEFPRANGIEPIFYLSVRPDDVVAEAKRLESLGAKYLFTPRYSEMADDAGKIRRFDNLKLLKESTECHVGITSDDFDEALDSAREGADWITFGRILRCQDSVASKKWIDAIHHGR